jgi:hypothetical protein
MVVVRLNHGNGVVLRLYKMVPRLLGTEEAIATGAVMELKAGRNEIDDEFWQAWLEQNKNSSLIAGKIIEQEKNEA